MGADQSNKEPLLVTQIQNPFCVVEPRFCLPTSVQIKLKENVISSSGDHFKITNANDGTLYFSCSGKAFGLQGRKTLHDCYGEPILNMKRPFISLSDKYTIFAGGNSDTELFQFKTERKYLKVKLTVYIKNSINNTDILVVLKGNWMEKSAVIYLGEPKEDGVPVAKIFRACTGKSIISGGDEYIVEIAPGVDIALIAMMCTALDDHQQYFGTAMYMHNPIVFMN